MTTPKTGRELFPKWLIRAKVYPTAQRVHILERPGLVEKLESSINAKLTLVHAPAGYGKSTLIAGCRNRLQDKGISVCWLSLDREDNDAFQLLTYIGYCLFEGGIDLVAAGADRESFLNDLLTRNLLSLITHVIAEQPGKIVLVLDDFENLESETIDAVILPLLNYAPENLHLIIGSRSDANLRIADLEAGGLAARLGSEHLKFSREELAALFPEETPAPIVKQLHRITEGWPVAVQMIRSATQGKQDVSPIVEQIRGDSGAVSAYLSEQVFNNLTPELQAFLMDVAILDRVDCDFVNHLRDRQDSLQRFNEARQLSSLVLPLDLVEATYRLHPLFREYLYERLMLTDPARRVKLHLRTSDWFAAQGDMVSAVRHCVKAGKPERAADIIEQAGGLVLWLKEGLTRLRAATDLLDEATIFASPGLTLIRCLLEIKDGKVYQASIHYQASRNQYRQIRSRFSANQQAQLTNEMMLLGSMLALYEGKQISAATCNELIEKIAGMDSAEHSTLSHHYTLLCLAHVQRGMFQAAREYAEQAIPQFRQINSLYGEVYIYFHMGDICFAEGKSEEAEKYYRNSLDMTRRHFNDDRSMRLVGHVLLSELKYENNRIDNLPGYVESIPRQLEEREAWFDIYAAGYTTASNLEYHKYGIDAALGVLDRASDYAREQRLTRLTNLLTAQRIELLSRSGRFAEAGTILQQSSITLDTYRDPDKKELAWRERDAAVHAISRLLIHSKEYDRALVELEHFAAHAKNFGHLRSCLKYAILQSIACHSKGESETAFEHLDEALNLSRKSGFIRSFIDEGREIKDLLEHSLESDTADAGNNSQVAAILRHFNEPGTDSTQPLLSNREMQIVQQLGQGYSNKVIARNIDISENTVRFHLKNIFNKLHVDSRLQAVAVARKRKII